MIEKSPGIHPTYDFQIYDDFKFWEYTLVISYPLSSKLGCEKFDEMTEWGLSWSHQGLPWEIKGSVAHSG